MYVERKRKRTVEPNELGMEVFGMADALLKSQQDLIEQQLCTIEEQNDAIKYWKSEVKFLRSMLNAQTITVSTEE
mgnify:FL=1